MSQNLCAIKLWHFILRDVAPSVDQNYNATDWGELVIGHNKFVYDDGNKAFLGVCIYVNHNNKWCTGDGLSFFFFAITQRGRYQGTVFSIAIFGIVSDANLTRFSVGGGRGLIRTKKDTS